MHPISSVSLANTNSVMETLVKVVSVSMDVACISVCQQLTQVSRVPRPMCLCFSVEKVWYIDLNEAS